eukprot:gene8432-11408_t
MMGRLSFAGGSVPSMGSDSSHGAGSSLFSSPSIASISSISMPSMGISSNMKKMDLGGLKKKMTNINIPSMPNIPNLPNLTGDDRRAKMEAEDKRNQISTVLSLLEDVRLQCPLSHTGLILAFTSKTSAPLIHPGIKFTWYRMTDEDKVLQLEESSRAWYAPTVDDIGSMICAQCEDNFEQGCSRYVECGPIKVDSLLCSIAESTVENGCYEVKDVHVSLGLTEKNEFDDMQSVSDAPFSPMNSTNHGQSLATVLSKNISFLQLTGCSTIEVDSEGVFISIPTLTPSHQIVSKHGSSNNSFKTSRRGLRIPGSVSLTVNCSQPLAVVLVVPITRKGIALSPTGSNDSEIVNNNVTPFADNSISTSPDKIQHVIEAEAILKSKSYSSEMDKSNPGTPIGREQMSSSSYDNNEYFPSDTNSLATPSKTKTSGEGDDEKMRRFLSSSIVAIPWTYVGIHSPEAYAAENESKLSTEEKEILRKEAEEDAIIFANTVCSLAEFISSLPEGTEELRICFSCPDRLSRDALALGIRSLACQPLGCTMIERMKCFPWLSSNGEKTVELVAENGTDADGDVRRRLRALEEENVSLKRERNELTIQLLEQREEMVLLKNNTKTNHQLSNGYYGIGNTSNYSINVEENENQIINPEESESQKNNHNFVNTQEKTASYHHNISHNNTSNAMASSIDHLSELCYGGGIPESEDDHDHDHGAALETVKSLSSKVIELENKIFIISKREAESSKLRSDIENRNNKLQIEVDKYKSNVEELTRKLSSLQSIYEVQVATIARLEKDQENSSQNIADYIEKLQELNKLESLLTKRENELEELRIIIKEMNEHKKSSEEIIKSIEDEIMKLQQEKQDILKENKYSIMKLEEQLSEGILINKRQEREISSLKDIINNQEEKLEETKKIIIELKESEAKSDRLAGEVNHLQKKADSLSRDLKKVMKDDAMTIAEFEKALIRKSEECNDLQFLVNKLRDEEAIRQESVNSSSSLFSGLSASSSTPSSVSLGGLFKKFAGDKTDMENSGSSHN